MTEADRQLLYALDGHAHDVEGIEAALSAGADPRTPLRGKLPIQWLLEDRTRSDRLPACLRLLLDRGAALPDWAVATILLDDAEAVSAAVEAEPALLNHRTTLVSSFTSLVGVTLLHVAAEYGNYNAARALIDVGANVNATAAVDEHGFGGHTPIFHTVNSNRNRSQRVMRLLLDAGARTDVRVAGLAWGRSYDWETVFFDVTPISFAKMGMLPRVHREERDVSANLRLLLKASGRPVPRLANAPNRHLQTKAKG